MVVAITCSLRNPVYLVGASMTEETQQPEAPAQTESHTSTPDAIKLKDNKKEKCRPMTKVVIRRLPPTMTQEQFIEQVSPLPDYDYIYFVKADMSLGQYAFSRAYVNFVDQQDIFIFREKFDNYVFVDAKGTEYPAVVEFAPFQRLPKKRVGKKKDLKCGTLETDPYYISFLESLKNQEGDSGLGQPKTEYSYQPSDNASKKVTTTPLLEYLKQRKQEKQRLRDEKREERRRRDLERRRAKDEPTISKVLKNPDLGKEACKDNKENKEEKEKLSPKDLRNRSKREEKFRDKLPTRERDVKATAKGYRDDRNKDRDTKHQKKHEERKSYVRKDDGDNNPKEDRRNDTREDKRYETKEESKDVKERRMEEKRGKSYEKMRQEKKRLAEAKKQNVESNAEGVSSVKPKKEEQESSQKKEKKVEAVSSAAKKVEKAQASKDDDDARNETSQSKQETEDEKTEANGVTEEKVELTNTKRSSREKDAAMATFSESISAESVKSKSNDHLDREIDYSTDIDRTKNTKLVKRRSSLESGGEGGGGDGGNLRRHKSLDGGDQRNLKKDGDNKEKGKKDPRLERRIRNKDRPAMEIYRPGMGKFSKQRLEREKSSNDERASLSQSPTPSSAPSTVSKSSKSATEVRTMTFKRSVSRDLS